MRENQNSFCRNDYEKQFFLGPLSKSDWVFPDRVPEVRPVDRQDGAAMRVPANTTPRPLALRLAAAVRSLQRLRLGRPYSCFPGVTPSGRLLSIQ